MTNVNATTPSSACAVRLDPIAKAGPRNETVGWWMVKVRLLRNATLIVDLAGKRLLVDPMLGSAVVDCSRGVPGTA